MQTMRRISAPLAASLIWIPLSVGVSAYAQTTEQAPVQGTQVLAPVVPQQVRFTGQLATRSGDTVEAVFSIYAAPEGGDPLWTETQQVAIDAEGSYTVLLGSASPAGLPQTLFAGGAARWLGVSVERAPELTRVLLSSVPYAMKSADAQALSGHPAGDFVTQGQLSEQLSQFAQTESHTQSPDLSPLTSGTVTGSGTSGRIPIWTGTLTQGSSVMYGVGSDIGIGSSAPAATLDVNGSGIIRGTLTMSPLNTATTSTGQASQLTEWQSSAWSTTAAAAVTPTYRIFMSPVGNDTATPSGSLEFNYQLGTTSTTVMQLASNGSLITGGIQMLKPYVASTSGPVSSPVFEFSGSSYSSTTSSAVAQNYELEVVPTGNNTSSPSSYLALLYGSGTTTPAQTGLTISPKGVIGWATGQTFPITGTGGGTITGITTSSPLTGSGTSGSVALGLNTGLLLPAITPPLETTFNTIYPQLGAGNTFTGSINIFTGSISAASNGYTIAAEGNGTSGAYGIVGDSDTGTGVVGYSVAPAEGAAGVLGFLSGNTSPSFTTIEAVGTAGVWGDANGAPGGADWGAGIIGTASSTVGYGGVFYNKSTVKPSVLAENAEGTGIHAYDEVPAIQQGAVVGTTGSADSTEFGTYYLTSGVWGDTNTASTGTLYASGLIGTADNAFAGLFYNNSNSWPTIFVQNDGTDGTGLSLFSTVMAVGKGGACGIGGNGDLSCTGQVKSIVSAGGGSRKVETYAMQSPENWMEDFGAGQLEKGVAVVSIDPTFAETVSESADYHVFLTPKGDSKGLYVINETPTSFEVRESGGGTSSLSFDYRIVAKRRGYETQRHVDVTERYNSEMKTASMPRASGVPRNSAALPERSMHMTAGSHSRALAPPLPSPTLQQSKNRSANITTHP